MPRFHLPNPVPRRPIRAAALALSIGLAGCQSYQPRPLDLPAHADAFLARTPDSQEVREFAQSLAAGVSQVTFDPSDGLTCPEAEVIALVYNADLRLARLRAGITRASADHAGLWEDPTLGVDLTRILQSTPEPWKLFSTLGLTIPVSGRLAIEQQRADAQHAAELARLALREWAVRMSVRRAWREWSALDAQLAAGRDFLTRVDQVLAVVNKMEQAGEIARTEARLFRIEKATRASDLALLASSAARAELELRRLMGLAPNAPLRFHPQLHPQLQPHLAAPPPAATLEHTSLAIQVATAEYRAAERTLELEVRKQYPDLHLSPGYGREDAQDQVLLGLSLPLPILNANRRAIAEARAQRELARGAAETTLEQTVAAVRATELRLAAAETHRRTLENEIVPLVDAQYDDARQVARLGEVNTLVLLESLKRQHEAKLALVAAARDEALAAVDLDELRGPPLSPTTPSPSTN
ncbi:MAG TPA: TolC family protein [Phycisphaerales bacterium]